MAMIKCPECGKDISDKAAACPNCGCPVAKTNEINNEQNEKGYTRIAAQSEKREVESRVTRGKYAAGITAPVMGRFLRRYTKWGI